MDETLSNFAKFLIELGTKNSEEMDQPPRRVLRTRWLNV